MRRCLRRKAFLRTIFLAMLLGGVVAAAATLGRASPSATVARGFASKFAGGSAFGAGAGARRGPASPTAITETTLNPVAADTSPALAPCPVGYRPAHELPELRLRQPVPSGGGTPDPVLQKGPARRTIPTPLLSFDGATNTDNGVHNGFLLAPPDNDGDVGPNHYVQFINELITVYSKTTGAATFGPCSDLAIWRNFADTTCRNTPEGDPVIAYDRGAGRWVLAEFAFPSAVTAPYHMCLAVSTSGDPTGTYYRYSYNFQIPGGSAVFPDYPKLGIWPDGYYMSINEFGPASPYPFLGGGAIAYDRTKMIAGNATAQAIWFQGAPYSGVGVPELDGGLLPSDVDSPTNPPAGDPNVFLQFVDNNNAGYPADKLKVWKFHADFANPSLSTFTNPYDLSPAAFDSTLCGYNPCVPQPATTDKLDTLSDRLMYRLVYRRFTATTGPTAPAHETWVVDHTVDATGNDQAGIRWYELRNLNGTGSIFQQGTFAGSPQDAKHRWMASTNIDSQGNIALGYSISDGTTQFPSVFYTARLVSDPLGTLPQGEGTLVSGTGSQLMSGGRWGDYTTLDIDPTDDCTFWHTNEYYAATAAFAWRTRIGSFRLCLPTAVSVVAFAARWERNAGARVSWRTKNESQILGFNVYRVSGKGSLSRVNPTLIHAKRSGRPTSASYAFLDRLAARKHVLSYKLQVVGLTGVKSWYGVGSAPVRG